MTIEEAKSIRIADYLHSLGYSPVKQQGINLWYKSPFREESEASFKVNTEREQWYDFGLGKGGNIIALAAHLYATDHVPYILKRIAEQTPHVRPVSFSFGKQSSSEPSFQQLEIVPLSSPALLAYLQGRGINIELAKEKGAFIYGICNAVGSSIPRITDTGSYIHVGPEIGVASTKAFTGQVTVLTMLALTLAKEKGSMTDEKYLEVIRELTVIPAKIKKILISNPKIAELSRIFTYAHNFLYLGRGYSFPVALEGALKLKEISYIHAEGYPAAEMKHGPIALIDAEMPVVVVATHNAMYEKIMSNIQEIKARKGKVIALVTEGDTVISKLADDCIELPETLECLEPLIATIPLQLLAYHVAICKGKNVDQPRNLAKSVTVE